MNLHQQERQSAAQAFEEAIDQLQTVLQSDAPPARADSAPQPTAKPAVAAFDLSSFEQAAADIEQFIQARAQKEV